jgi:hypothetical protein
MKHQKTHQPGSARAAFVTFLAVFSACLALTCYLGLTAPAEKQFSDYLAHGIFSALFALPTGAAWRAFRQTTR